MLALVLGLVALGCGQFSAKLVGGGSSGATVAPYALDLTVGGRVVRVVPDTQSSQLAVASPACKCARGGGYEPSASAVATTCNACRNGTGYLSCTRCNTALCGTCQTDVSLRDGGSAVGYWFLDGLAVNGSLVRVYAASMYWTQGAFCDARYDGVWGMAYALRAEGVPTVLDQLAKSGMQDIFSVCYGSYSDGMLSIGFVKQSHTDDCAEDGVTVPMDVSRGLVAVSPASFSMAEEEYVPQRRMTAVVGTREAALITSDQMLVERVLGWLIAAAERLDGGWLAKRVLDRPREQTCFSRQELAQFVPCFPDLRIAFVTVNGTQQSVSVPAWSYFWITDGGGLCGEYAVTLGVRLEQVEAGVDVVLGSAVLRSVHTTVDRRNSLLHLRRPRHSECGTSLANVSDTRACAASREPLWGGRPAWQAAVAVAGAVAVTAILLVLACWCYRRNRRKKLRGRDYELVGADSLDPGAMSLYPK